MQVLVAKFETRDGLSAAFREALAENAMFLSGEYSLTAGERVLVKLSVPRLEPGVFVEGVVQGRRLRKGVDDGLGRTAGLNVQLLPHERVPYAFLRSWAAGDRADNGRSRWRYPSELRAHIHAGGASRATSRVLHGSTVNVSETGVMVSVPRMLPAEADAVLMVEFEGALRDFEARITWASETRAGLRLALVRSEERTSWDQIVRTVRNSVETRQSVSSSSMRPPPLPR